MAILSRKAILTFTIIIAVLQIIHVILLSQLKKSAFLDSSGQMTIVNNLLGAKPAHKINSNDITLVTQSSLSSFHHLLFLTRYWKGFISIAIFSLTTTLDITIESILFFQKCFPYAASNISFHLVFPLFNSSLILTKAFLSSHFNSFSSFTCDQFNFAIKSKTFNLNYDYDGFEYPINLLRNVASSNVLTKFKLVIDIDLVPNLNLKESFLKFAKQYQLWNVSSEIETEKNVYILPVFEIKNEKHIPNNKTTLLKMIKSGSSRPFYYELCWKCQKYTNYERWKLEPIENDLKVSFEVEWHDPWEPFFISRVSVPKYDERFKQYGFNRISQVCELYVAGYKFLILNSVFLIHKGFKTKNSFHSHKDIDLIKNRCVFQKFKEELKVKYPDSHRHC